jgi:hypothetical protein
VFKKTLKRDLEPPPIASSNSQAVEILRVWAAPGQPQQLTLRTTWKDAGAWGLLLADIARHAANAYANEGQNSAEVLARIQQLLNAEFSQPKQTSQFNSDKRCLWPKWVLGGTLPVRRLYVCGFRTMPISVPG